MRHISLRCTALAFILTSAYLSPVRAQDQPKTDQDKVANAMLAAPTEIGQNATIRDWPAKQGGEQRVLREGSNGWVCLPDEPSSPGNDPMCLDGEWQKFMAAYMTKAKPEVRQTGVAYMLGGSGEGSNTDPFATGPTPDNQWHKYGPHIMVVVPDAKALEGISSDPGNGGPYVMFKGTPYAHVMVPVR
jgi:hypothetical protein